MSKVENILNCFIENKAIKVHLLSLRWLKDKELKPNLSFRAWFIKDLMCCDGFSRYIATKIADFYSEAIKEEEIKVLHNKEIGNEFRYT